MRATSLPGGIEMEYSMFDFTQEPRTGTRKIVLHPLLSMPSVDRSLPPEIGIDMQCYSVNI